MRVSVQPRDLEMVSLPVPPPLMMCSGRPLLCRSFAHFVEEGPGALAAGIGHHAGKVQPR